jgi:DNA-binding transcriptional LysR family regulator
VLLTQIEAFVEVAREGALGRAATNLYVSQPALTARLQALELELGQPLFARSRRGMTLTDAGRTFLPYAERSLEALRSGKGVLADVGRGTIGELAIGAAPAVSTYVLPPLLDRYVREHPSVRLLVRTGHSEEIVDMVLRSDVQFGLVRELRDGRVQSEPLYEDELVLVVSPTHAFAESWAVPVETLAGERLIFFDRTSSYYDLTNAMFREAGVSPRGAIELDNIDAAKKMVEQSLGVALLPNTAVSEDVDRGALVRVPLTGARPIRRRIMLITRPQAEVSGPAIAFRRLLSQIPELVPGARAVSPPP